MRIVPLMGVLIHVIASRVRGEAIQNGGKILDCFGFAADSVRALFAREPRGADREESDRPGRPASQ
jgi:hypothetical protein